MSSHTDTKTTISPTISDESHISTPHEEPVEIEDGTISTYNDLNHKSLPDPSLLHPDAFRRLSTSTLGGFSDDSQRSRSHSFSSHISARPTVTKGWKGVWERFWQRNRGLWLVTISQFFGALMNVTTRILETEEDGMHPFQVLFVRMSLTMILCCLYMWYTKVEHFPLGPRKIRGLLVCRGLVGFFGIFGMYYSLLYLPLSDAVVITFLAPSVAGYACYLFIGEPFTRMEQIASFIALSGVILIARPTSFFSTPEPIPSDSPGENFSQQPTSAQRLSAIGVAMLGVVGSAGAYTTIRWIGKNAHPLISVNYFATWCTILSTSVLTMAPSFGYPHLHFVLPKNLQQWLLLGSLGLCGFVMQFLLTAGMAHEKSNRATNMVYTNMLWALLFDHWVFGISPGWWSIIGSSLILGSAVYVAVQKGSAPTVSAETLVEMERHAEEGRGMLSDVEEQGDVELGHLR